MFWSSVYVLCSILQLYANNHQKHVKVSVGSVWALVGVTEELRTERKLLIGMTRIAFLPIHLSLASHLSIVVW